MTVRRMFATSTLVLGALPAWAQQPFPTTQPAIIQITREIEKPMHFVAHEQTETRWAALSRSHSFPTSVLALVASSGVPEAWFLSTYSGLDALGKVGSFGGDNPTYMAALGKIALEDAEHLTNVITTQAVAVPGLSRGAFPDVKTVRVYSIATVQLRTGQDAAFTELTQRYIAFLESKGVQSAWRTYSVLAGAPDGTLLIFASFPSWEAVEADRKAANAAMASAAPADMAALSKGWADAVANSNTRYFNVNPRMSVVPKEMMSDPFWSGK